MFGQVIDWIVDNIKWIFSGVGVLVISFLLTKKRLPASSKNKQPIDKPSDQNRTSDIQKGVHILFIDDEEFQVVQMLKNDGWKAVSRIDDPNSIRAQEIIDSDVIFVDIIGVGKALGFKNQGIGLAAEIKRRYPLKRVVIYSGEEKHSVFDSDLHAVDNWLPKNAEPIQFIQEIENYESNRD